jgi:hypothetical protein
LHGIKFSGLLRTTPDSKAIRNSPGRTGASMRCGPCFNFPGQQSEPAPGLARIRAPHHHVSTSPDNKVNRNQPRPPHPGSAAKVLTSPDCKAIRNQSGTGVLALRLVLVPTSPDSKTIRKLAAKELRKVIIDPVSTSPDSKAIRNELAHSPGSEWFPQCFNFPGYQSHPERSHSTKPAPSTNRLNFSG